MMISKKTFQKPSQEQPYTKFPNRYNDLIRPQLTDTQRDVCEIVIRLTYGWQREQARITNKTFVSKSSKSERAIITAKKQLIDIKLLIMVEAPRGTRAGLYKLDPYYNNPAKAQMPIEEEFLQEILSIIDPTAKNDLAETLDNGISAESLTNELEFIVENPVQAIEKILPIPFQAEQPIAEAQPEAPISDSQQSKSSVPKMEINTDDEKDYAIPSTEVSSALHNDCTDPAFLDQVQNKQTENENEKKILCLF